MKINRISSEDQEKILESKIDTRVKYTTLTDSSHPNSKANQVIAYDLCMKDWKFAIDNFYWIHDPEATDSEKKNLPFLLWDFQEQVGDEIVKAIEGGYDLPIEKCRKLGLTWLVTAICVWGWQFHEWDVLVGSRKFEEVDKKGDMGTLFQKMRYILEKLPEFLFPEPLNNYTDKVGMVIHPVHKASIAGEGNNPDFGRSDRRKVVFLDEFTSWEQTDRAAWQGLSATTKCRIPVSTPNRRGVNCFFWQIIQNHKKDDKPVLSLPWHLHPEFSAGLRPTQPEDGAFEFNEEFTSPWLENEIKRAVDRQSVAQEILINYEASMAGKVFADFSVEKQVSDDVEYRLDLPLYIAWDFGLDQTAMLFIQHDRKKNLYYIFDEYVNDGSREGDNIYHYLDVLDEKDYKMAIHFGDPHSGENRSMTASGQSNAGILRRQGIIFRSDRTAIKSRVASGRNLISQVRVSSKCTLAIEMFTSWQLKQPRTGVISVGIPDHSIHSHIGEAYTYFCWNIKKKNSFSKRAPSKKYDSGFSGVM